MRVLKQYLFLNFFSGRDYFFFIFAYHLGKTLKQSEQHLKDGGLHSVMVEGLKRMVKSWYSENRAFFKILLPTFFSVMAINKTCKFSYFFQYKKFVAFSV